MRRLLVLLLAGWIGSAEAQPTRYGYRELELDMIYARALLALRQMGIDRPELV